VHEADAGLVDQAVKSARSALSGPYGRSAATERVRMLRKAADVVERRFDELVDAEVGDTGKPYAQARTLDVARAAINFRAFEVYNVVHGFGRNSAGQFLTEHPGIDGVTFTGSTATGAVIMRAVAPRVRPVSFELGGKNAAVVFDDVDVEKAVAGLTRSLFTNAGQVCLCTERVYVHRPIFDEVVGRLADAAKGLRLGLPSDAATTMGPLISQAHRRKVEGYVRIADEPARADPSAR
jgi:acyl-CoA reductase-like NAD-dependent aldehyde dehydrogenase